MGQQDPHRCAVASDQRPRWIEPPWKEPRRRPLRCPSGDRCGLWDRCCQKKVPNTPSTQLVCNWCHGLKHGKLMGEASILLVGRNIPNQFLCFTSMMLSQPRDIDNPHGNQPVVVSCVRSCPLCLFLVLSSSLAKSLSFSSFFSVSLLQYSLFSMILLPSFLYLSSILYSLLFFSLVFSIILLSLSFSLSFSPLFQSLLFLVSLVLS